jgi:hypothetical protein
VTAANKPQRLSQAFPIKLKNGSTMLAMLQGRGRGKSRLLKFMYTLSKEARIPERLHFHDTAEQIVVAEGESCLLRGIQYALDTAK